MTIMRNLVAIFSVLLCFTLYHQADGLKCYVCAGNCSDPKELECIPSSRDFVCLSSSSKVEGETVDAKFCMPNTQATKDACNAIDDSDGESCYTCDSDLCNSAEIYSISVLLLASLFFFLMKM